MSWFLWQRSFQQTLAQWCFTITQLQLSKATQHSHFTIICFTNKKTEAKKVNNSSGLFQTSKEDDIKSHCSYLSWLMNEVRDKLPHFTLWNNQVLILKFAFINISSQEQPDSCIILWSRRKGKSCEGGWKMEGWSGWEAKPWKDTPWTLKKQWVLGANWSDSAPGNRSLSSALSLQREKSEPWMNMQALVGQGNKS